MSGPFPTDASASPPAPAGAFPASGPVPVAVPPAYEVAHDPVPGRILNGFALGTLGVALLCWALSASTSVLLGGLILHVVVLVVWVAKLVTLLWQTHRRVVFWGGLVGVAAALAWSVFAYSSDGPYSWARDVTSAAVGMGIVVLLFPPVLVLVWLEASRDDRQVVLPSWEATPVALLVALLVFGFAA